MSRLTFPPLGWFLNNNKLNFLPNAALPNTGENLQGSEIPKTQFVASIRGRTKFCRKAPTFMKYFMGEQIKNQPSTVRGENRFIILKASSLLSLVNCFLSTEISGMEVNVFLRNVRLMKIQALQIDDWVQRKFLPAMPLMAAFGIDTSSQSMPSPHRPTPGCVDIYLQAVDSRGAVVGIAVVKESVVFGPDVDSSPEWDRMADFMNFIEQAAKLQDLPGRTMELLVLSVAEECRGRGVARRLILEAETSAREAKFDTLYVCCTSEYAARAARSAGWQEHFRLAYKDYPGVSGTEGQLIPTPPHEHVYFYIKLLRNKTTVV